MPMTLRPRRLPAGFWKSSTSKSRASRPTRPRLPRKTTKAVAKIAKTVMMKNSETKYVTEYWGESPQYIYGSTFPAGGTPQLFDCLPALGQGTNSCTRVGERVTPRAVVADLDFTFNNNVAVPGVSGADVASWDITVHVWYGYARRVKSNGLVLAQSSVLVNQLFEDGDGTSSGFTGDPYDILKKVNTDVLSLKHKKFRMFRPYGIQNQATTVAGAGTFFPQIIKKRCKLTFKPPKQLLYDEQQVYPDNYAPFCIIGYEHNDNTQSSNTIYVPGSPTVLNVPAIQVQGLNKLWYKDA